MALIAIIHIPDHTTGDDILGSAAPINVLADQGRLVGLFNFPSRHELKCAGSCVVKGKGSWGRDPRGFMKCSVCGFRNRDLRKWFIRSMFDWFGANLIPDPPAAFRTPEGYGSHTTD
jgi:hypothetical protein